MVPRLRLYTPNAEGLGSEVRSLDFVLCNKRSHCTEKPAHCKEGYPACCNERKPAATKIQRSQK